MSTDDTNATRRGSGSNNLLGLVERLRAPSMTDTTATHIDRMRMAADEIERLRAALGSIHWRVARSDTAFDDIAAAVLTEICEQACPELRALGPNVELTGPQGPARTDDEH